MDLVVDLGRHNFLVSKCCVHKMIDLEVVVNITNIGRRGSLSFNFDGGENEGKGLYFYTIPLSNLNNKSVDLLIVT